MHESVRDRLNDHRPYWKVLVSLIFSLVGTILFIYLGLKGISYFMPFVIGWCLAFIAAPIVNWLEEKVKLKKKLGSALIIIAVLAICIFIIYFVASRLLKEVFGLLNSIPQMYNDLEANGKMIAGKWDEIFALLPPAVHEGWEGLVDNFDTMAGELIAKISEPTVEAAGNITKKIPSIFVSTIVMFISSYFFIAEREEAIMVMKKIVPSPIVKRMSMVTYNLKYAMGGYFKAQFKIMGVVFVILLTGFSILGIHFSALLAIAIAVLDFLPFFGTGAALIPWSLYKLLTGDYKMMIALLIIHGITQLVRQLIQPKLVGDSIGLDPLVTLFLLFVGYKTGGIIAMIFAVPVGVIVFNLYKAGAFDYILDDFWILTEGVLSLRK